MADYSNQYSWKYLGFKGDFDIFKEAKKLKREEYISLSCEGYGFIAIMKDENKEIKFALPKNGFEEVDWVDYYELKKRSYKKSLN